MRKQIFSISIILVFIFTTISFAADPNLVGWWKLDSGASDSSGYDNHGTIYGNPTWTTGQIDGALNLDGIDDCVLVPDANSLDVVTGDMTLSVWINPADLGDGGIVGKYGNWSYYNYALWYESETIFFEVGRRGTSSGDSAHFETKVNSSIIDTANRWYHVVGTYDHNAVRLYVDTNEVDSANESRDLGTGGGPLCISNVRYDGFSSHSFNETNEYFNGIIDDVRIYDYALSTEEIVLLYEYEGEGIAFAPNPYNSQKMVDPNIILSWYPGIGTADVNGHDVYFGTDYNDVTDANTTVTLGAYQGRQDANTWDPCGLEWGKWYYWRVDEVNDSNNDSPWKGNVWSFETAAPSIELSASQFVFHSDWVTNPDNQILSINNNGIGTLNWEISYDCNWLTVDPNNGSSTGQLNEVTLSVDITGLAEGEYDCDLVVSDPCAENNPQVVSVILNNECFPFCNPDYSEWVAVGRPYSWCYPRQCHGDADGLENTYGTAPPPIIPWPKAWVTNEDLQFLVAGYKKVYGGNPAVDTWIAADFNHQINTFGIIPPPMAPWPKARVTDEDVQVLVIYYKAAVVPTDCQDCP